MSIDYSRQACRKTNAFSLFSHVVDALLPFLHPNITKNCRVKLVVGHGTCASAIANTIVFDFMTCDIIVAEQAVSVGNSHDLQSGGVRVVSPFYDFIQPLRANCGLVP
jgi:hypothetical protein